MRRNILLTITIFAALATVTVGWEVNSQLINAFLERLVSDPASCDESRIFWNSTEKKAKVCNGTAWTGLGGGSGTGVNYIESPDSATGWTDHEGGITIATTTTSSEFPDVGVDTQAIKLTNENTGTDGVSYCFQVGESRKNYVLGVSWVQRCDGSLYDTGDFEWKLVSDTSSDCSGTESPVVLLNSGSSSAVDIEAVNGVVEDSFVASEDYYQLYIERAAGTDSGWCTFSSVTVGPQVPRTGPVKSTRIAYTPGNSSWGTASTAAVGYYIQDGDEVYLDIKDEFDGTISGNLSWSDFMPNSWTVDESRLNTGAGGGAAGNDHVLVGTFLLRDGGTRDYMGWVYWDRSDNGLFFDTEADGVVTSTSPITATSADGVHLLIKVPVTELDGKGVTQYLTPSMVYANARIVYTSNTGTYDHNDTVIFEDVVEDTFGLYDTSTGIFDCPADGDYLISGSVRINEAITTTAALSVALNGSTNYQQIYSSGPSLTVHTIIPCDAGENIRILMKESNAGSVTLNTDSTYNRLTITRISDFTAGTNVGSPLADENKAGVVFANKWQTKKLSADVTTDADLSTTTSNSDFKFENLTIGKTYRVYLQASFSHSGDDNAIISITHDGTVIGRAESGVDFTAFATGNTIPAEAVFTATATTVTFVSSSVTAATIRGNDTFAETYARLEELNNYGEEGSAW